MARDYKLYSEFSSDDDLLLCDIHTPKGIISFALLSEYSIFIILHPCSDPAGFYAFIREALSAARVHLYVIGQGEFDPVSGTFQNNLPEEALGEEIARRCTELPVFYSRRSLRYIRDRLIYLDAQSRGYHKDASGTLYILRNGIFQKASSHNSDHIFALCLYGGVFGLHRFALGKWFSGLVYAFTCGLFLFGWLTDLFQLFLGFMRDDKRQYLFPLKDRTSKLKKLPAGIFWGLAAMFLYAFFTHTILRHSDDLLYFLQKLMPGSQAFYFAG